MLRPLTGVDDVATGGAGGRATQRRESSERLEATQRGPAVGGEIDEHDSRRQRDGRRGGEVAAAQGMCGHGALASCRLAELPCLGCKWAGPAK